MTVTHRLRNEGLWPVEVYTDEDFLEVETLATLKTLEPGEPVELVVEWTLERIDDRGTLLDAFRTIDESA